MGFFLSLLRRGTSSLTTLLLNQQQQRERIQKWRQEARDQRDQAQTASAESQRAYQQGRHDVAKSKSQEATQCRAEMSLLNKKAADLAFSLNNQGRPANEIDLHDLSVQEALDRLQGKLSERKIRDGKTKVLLVITGKGQRSGADGPRVKPAVLQWLQEHGYSAEIDPRNEGCVIVQLRSSERRRCIVQ